jgi:hypothetical protein
LREWLREAKNAIRRPLDWLKPIAILEQLKRLQPDDPYLIQQLALATYKSEQPDKLRALVTAKKILEQLEPTKSSDAETVGLWGAIHKRLWTIHGNADDLDEAIRAYRRGFYIKTDYYNGINYAFLLDTRAAETEGREALADRVFARRIRGDVLVICEERLKGPLPGDEGFWVEATKVEALLGLGRDREAEALRAALIAKPGVEPWMIASLDAQLAELRKLLEKAAA